MILSRYNLIYLHAPKTGGNSIQELLLPHSDDKMVLRSHQDGVDRYEIAGPATSSKHADLQSYADAIGGRLSDFTVAISVRHPFDRALSFYFSPHRWMRQRDGGWHLEPPHWDINAFAQMLGRERSMVSFLSVDGKVRMPNIVIRYETLAYSFAEFCAKAGLPISQRLAHRNKSASLKLKVLERDNAEARKIVEAAYSEDFALFGYTR